MREPISTEPREPIPVNVAIRAALGICDLKCAPQCYGKRYPIHLLGGSWVSACEGFIHHMRNAGFDDCLLEIVGREEDYNGRE